jgi:hypothetical protein
MPNWDFYITNFQQKGLKAGAFNPLNVLPQIAGIDPG